MNNNLRNFFSEKNYKISSKSESLNIRFSIVFLCLLNYFVVTNLNFELEIIKEVFLKLEYTSLIIGFAIVTTSFINTFFEKMLKTFFVILATFLYIINTLLLSFYSYNQDQAFFLNIVILIFLILPLKSILNVAITMTFFLGIFIIGFILTPNNELINLLFYISACVLLYYIQVRQLNNKKYLETVQNYLISIANSGKKFYLLINSKLQIVACNSLAVTFWGEGELENLEGKSVTSYISVENINVFINDIERVVSSNVEVEREMQLIDSNGKAFWVITNISPLKISNQTYISIIANNISTIKHTETQLRDAINDLANKKEDMELNQKAMINMLEDIEIQQKIAKMGEEETRTILENIADAVIVLDDKQRIRMVNKAAQTLTKIDSNELIKSQYTNTIRIFDEKDSPFSEYLLQTFAGNVVITENKYYLLTKDNEKVSVSISSAPSFDKNNKVDKCIIVIKDTTRTRQLERMKDEFISIASHQLRTPLTTIKWHSEIMGDFKEDIPKDLLPSVSFISQASERLIHLVTELLDVSRIDTGRNFEIEKAPKDLSEIIKKVLGNTEILAENKKIKINFEFDKKEEFTLDIDEFKITEGITNLLTNAIKYSGEKSVIDVKLTKDKELINVEIIDHGVGIPKKDQSRIFERFYRARNALTQEGTGLGLYITKSIVEAHGGKLEFVSNEGVGTTFTIKLPFK